MSQWKWLENFFRDSRYALIRLRKSPGFTAVAIITIALGIGANTAIFTLVHAILLSSLPVEKPSELYSLGDTSRCCDTTDFTEIVENFALYSYPLYKHLRDHTPEFTDLAAFQSVLVNFSVRRSGFARPYVGEFVSGNYFSLFGVGAFAGRTFTSTDDQPSAPPVAVMSYRTWRKDFGSDPSVVGTTLTLNGLPATVVGIASQDFFGDSVRVDPPDFWVPLSAEPALIHDDALLNQNGEYWLYVIGRLGNGTQPAQAQSRVLLEIQEWLTNLVGVSEHSRQSIAKINMVLAPANGGVSRLRNTYGKSLRLLMAVSSVVLLIACANVANLLLARGTANRLQTALRVALGAARGSLIRQAITEGVLLALLGGTAGVIIAFAGTRVILRLAFRGAGFVPIDATPSLPILAFAFFLSLVTGVIFSLAPAWAALKVHPMESLHGAGRSTRDHSGLARVLVIAQAALSLVLLAGAGLLAVSLRNLQNQQLGFQTQGRLIVRVNPSSAGYTPDRLPVLYRRLQDRFAQIPGVRSISLALQSPLTGSNFGTNVVIEGHAPSPDTAQDTAFYNFVSAHYFETIGDRLLHGRPIDEQDTPNSHLVAVINEAFARRFFPGEDPIGKHVGLNDISHSNDYEIVGIAEDAKFRDLTAAPDPRLFLPLLQLVTYQNSEDAAYQVRANYIDSIQLSVAGPPEDFEPVIRQALADINPDLAVVKFLTLEDQVGISLNGNRLIADLTTLYGILALILACIGLYGVAAYMVARRTAEIGIRMALGANRFNVVRMILRVAMRPIAIGLLIGVPMALVTGRIFASQLFGVEGYDPIIIGSATVVLTVSAVLAALVPACRAASVDPTRALRTE
jgi:macrolide transport system ATP-binding/permease protein